MDKLTLDVVKALVVLLPGFLVVGVTRSLFAGERETDSEKIIKAFTYSFIVYVIFVCTKAVFGKSGWLLDISHAFPLNVRDILLVMLLSMLVGLVSTIYKHHDLHRVWRWMRITDRSCRTTVWNDVFIDKKASYICVEFDDGRRLYGWPEYYSDDPKATYLFLADAEWLTEDEAGETERTPVPGHGILVCPTEKISFIQFVGTQRGDDKP